MQQVLTNIMEQLLLVFFITGRTLIGLLPYILAGIILGELARNLPWMETFSRWCRRSSIVALLLAALIGVISPLCTYGTIPLILMLASKGFPLPPLITFLLASSSLNPQLFFVTFGGINPEMALVRLITVIIFSVLAGFIMQLIPESSILVKARKNSYDTGNEEAGKRKKRLRESVRTMWKDLKYIGFFVLIGCLAGAVIEVYVPADRLTSVLHAGPAGSILVAAILGVPVYVCGGGIIPVIGSLISKGLNAGAALSFLTVGQAVRITPLTALASLLKVRFLIFFVISVILYSMIIGYIYYLIT